MRKINYPTYSKAIDAFLRNERVRFSRLQRSNDLSQIEKKFLLARVHLRNDRLALAAQLLSTLNPHNDFFKGEKNLLLATCAFRNGEFETSARYNLIGFDHYLNAKDQRGKFLTSYNASVDFSRLGQSDLSRKFFHRAEKLASSPSEKGLILRALACEQSNQGHFDDACNTLSIALQQSQLLHHIDRTALFAVAADIYFRAGKLKIAKEIFKNNLSYTRNHYERARIHFEISGIQLLETKKPLPNPPDLIQKNPEFLEKWNIIRFLQSGCIDQAIVCWQNLVQKNPIKFGPGFQCHCESESKSVFMICVKKYAQQSKQIKQNPIGLSGLGLKLFTILNESKTPLRKESLIELVWGKAYDPKDNARFYKLVERINLKYPGVIQNNHQCYILNKTAS